MTWMTERLGDLCTTSSGGTPSRGVLEFFGGPIPWAKISDLNVHDGIVLETEESISEAGLRAIGDRLFGRGTIMLAMYGSVGKLAIAGRELSANQAILGIVPRDERCLSSRYLRWWLAYVQPKLANDARGVTQANISKALVDDLRVPLPPIEEQRRIAAILDKADAIRRKRQDALALTDQLLRSTFLEMFGDPVSNPKGWPRKPLSEVSEIGSGIMKGRVYEGVRMLSVPYMRVANVQDGHVNLDDVKEIEFPASELEKYRLKAGDVLMTEGGDPDKLGRGALWNGEIDPCVHQNHVFRVRADGDVINPVYLVALLGTAYAKRYFLRQAKQTTGIATINKTQISAFPTLCPPIALQSSYADISTNVTTLHGRRAESAADAEALYQSLTHRAFTGQL